MESSVDGNRKNRGQGTMTSDKPIIDLREMVERHGRFTQVTRAVERRLALGATVVRIDDELTIDTSTPLGRKVWDAVVAFARYQSEYISARNSENRAKGKTR